MPYQPISPTPYLSTIDSTVDNVFTCVINPRDIISKYVLKIIDINSTTGEPVLTVTEDVTGLMYSGVSAKIDTTRITDNLQLPVRGDYKIDTMLKIPIPAHYILDKSSETNETDNEDKLYGDYIWNITLYDNNNKTTTSCDYYFKIRDKAEISLLNNETILSSAEVNNINSSNIYVHATYSQAQNILPAYYCFNVYLDNIMVYTTGNVISSNITLTYDSLISGRDYILELLIFDDDKTQSRYIYKLNVSYNYFSAPINPIISINNDKTFSTIDYSDNISIVGKCAEDVEKPLYKKYIITTTNEFPADENTNGACIPKEQILYWNERTIGVPLDLDNTCQLLNWHGHKGFSGNIVEKFNEENAVDKIVVGHNITNSIKHSSDSLIYIDSKDSFMPIGVLTNNIQGGFYYKFGTLPRTYISEFTKVTSAIYKSTIETDEAVAISQIKDDTLYIINDNDMLTDTNILLTNDTVNNYWWLIGILNNNAVVYRNEKYSETVVNE